MLHCNCGGDLKVVESFQIQLETGVKMYRVRKCLKCGARIGSNELIKNGMVSDAYRHKGGYKANE
mgnify:CR=1 FL=1